MIKQIFLIFVLILVSVYSNPVKTNPYVVGGYPVPIEAYPFVCAMFSGEYFSCGCSILNKKWVLTAAHCPADAVQWGLTEANVNAPMTKIIQWVRYPGWTSYQRDDIQLCELEEEITFGPNAQPVKLPPLGWEIEGSSYETPTAVFGRGHDINGKLTKNLTRGDYFAVSNDDCSKIHEDVAEIYDSNCCNGVIGGGVADCIGDSGGPIVTWINGEMVEYGIVSWSVKPCMNPTFPAVGTKTSHYVEWISEMTKIPLEQLTVKI